MKKTKIEIKKSVKLDRLADRILDLEDSWGDDSCLNKIADLSSWDHNFGDFTNSDKIFLKLFNKALERGKPIISIHQDWIWFVGTEKEIEVKLKDIYQKLETKVEKEKAKLENNCEIEKKKRIKLLEKELIKLKKENQFSKSGMGM
jgi:hypothetical protein